jgi:hypothetical protein
MYPDHDPAMEPAGHHAEVFGSLLVISVESGRERDGAIMLGVRIRVLAWECRF